MEDFELERNVCIQFKGGILVKLDWSSVYVAIDTVDMTLRSCQKDTNYGMAFSVYSQQG